MTFFFARYQRSPPKFFLLCGKNTSDQRGLSPRKLLEMSQISIRLDVGRLP